MNVNLIAIDNMISVTAGPVSTSLESRTGQVDKRFEQLKTDWLSLHNYSEDLKTDNINYITSGRFTKSDEVGFSCTLQQSIKSPLKSERHIEITHTKQTTQTSDKTNDRATRPKAWTGSKPTSSVCSGSSPPSVTLTPNVFNTLNTTAAAVQELLNAKLLLTKNAVTKEHQLCLKEAKEKMSSEVKQLAEKLRTNLNNVSKSLITATGQKIKDIKDVLAADVRGSITEQIENNKNAKEMLEKSLLDTSKASSIDQKSKMKNPAARPQGIKDFYKGKSCSSPCGKPQGIIKLKEPLIALAGKKVAATANLSGVQERPNGTKRIEQFDLGKSASINESQAKDKSNKNQMFYEHSKGNTPNQPNTLKQDLSVERFQVSDMRISASQTKDRSDLPLSRSSNLEIEQVLSTNNTQMHNVLQSSPTAQTATIAINGPGGIGQQILESIYVSLGRAERQITIQLNPPELGRVFIKFEQQQDEIICSLQVSKQETRYEIEQVLPGVIRFLQDSGVQIRRVDVMLTDQPERQLDKESFLQDSYYQQSDFEQGETSDNNSANNWMAIDTSYQKGQETQIQINSSGINMLV